MIGLSVPGWSFGHARNTRHRDVPALILRQKLSTGGLAHGLWVPMSGSSRGGGAMARQKHVIPARRCGFFIATAHQHGRNVNANVPMTNQIAAKMSR